MNIGLDEYSRNARLKPALLVVLPLALTIAVWSPSMALAWSALWATIVAMGGTFFLGQIGRDWGKRKEQQLFDRFGGRPTERALCHEHAPNKVRLAAQHARLATLMPAISMPTADDERHDPSAAHNVYDACTRFLIARSRGNRLVLQENINYGFRRNLWGMKPLGLSIALACAIGLGASLYANSASGFSSDAVAVEALNVLITGAWLIVITPRWVMVPAEAYADRLLETLEQESQGSC